MPANIAPIYPASANMASASLTSATPVTSRSDIVGTTGLVLLTPTGNANGSRIDALRVKSKGTSVFSILFVWLYDGTTSRLYDEINIVATTASTTANSFAVTQYYDTLGLSPTQQLYISQTVASDCDVYATVGVY